ncbi:MAG: DUF1289 domain-containing protein [Hyphomicrobiales bacterium]|nr:DUF1289 domain-containing protein [Hyphomicrobiales bacterium]
MSTPCILVCVIDDRSGYCFGRGCTSDEISKWTNYPDDEHNKKTSDLNTRFEMVERKPRRPKTRRSIIAGLKNNFSRTIS